VDPERLERARSPVMRSRPEGGGGLRRPLLGLLSVVFLIWALGSSSAAAATEASPVVTGRQYPAMFTVAGDGRIFYAETYTGRIGVFAPQSGVDATYFQVPDLCESPDQGLFGIALRPKFTSNNTLYAYVTRQVSGGCHNQVLEIHPRATGGLAMDVLLDDPYVAGHVGGRLLFGPDGDLYVSTGDGSSGLPTLEAAKAERAAAQDLSSVKGKILRMTNSGGVPARNPYGNLVFAYGFRNVFGFDFDPLTGRLWATDNGTEGNANYPEPSGPGPLGGCNDEVNLVTIGSNYGWGPTGNCGTPPVAPLNTNRDGPSPVLPALNVDVASGITAARFCSGCGLGPQYEGRLFWADYDYRDGFGAIHAAILSPDRSAIASDEVVYQPSGPAPLSIERGPDCALYYSDPNEIYKLVDPSAQPGCVDPAPTLSGGQELITGAQGPGRLHRRAQARRRCKKRFPKGPKRTRCLAKARKLHVSEVQPKVSPDS